jgi:hypothetical protein
MAAIASGLSTIIISIVAIIVTIRQPVYYYRARKLQVAQLIWKLIKECTT